MTKSQLRKHFLTKQKSLSPQERQNLSRKVAENFFTHFDLTEIKVLHCFLPMEKFNEINTMLIFERLWNEFPNVETFVPKVDFREDEIQSIRFTQESSLRENKWSIKEPQEGKSIKPAEIDIILVPLVCFDLNGFRIGYGKGFYDRFLKKCRRDARKIGLSYFEPVEKIADVQEHDVKLDFCITPEKIFEF